MGLREQFSHERAWSKGPGIQDGADIERAVLGAAKILPAERKDEYMSFSDALVYVRQHQPDVLKRSRMVRDLRNLVVELCLDTEHPVKFYTAVETPLDTYHGVDAFFEQGSTIVTIDVSLREKIKQKADVLLKVGLDDEGRPIVSSVDLQSVANQIARKLNHKNRKAA